MLRSGIRSEIFYFLQNVPSRHGKERFDLREKRLFPWSLSSTTSTKNASPLPFLPGAAALHASEALLAAINSSLSDD